MVKKNTSGIALYKEDLKQSIEELTDLQRKMLSLTLSDLNPEDFNLDKIYPCFRGQFFRISLPKR